jgi:hypothetical protein
MIYLIQQRYNYIYKAKEQPMIKIPLDGFTFKAFLYWLIPPLAQRAARQRAEQERRNTERFLQEVGALASVTDLSQVVTTDTENYLEDQWDDLESDQ